MKTKVVRIKKIRLFKIKLISEQKIILPLAESYRVLINCILFFLFFLGLGDIRSRLFRANASASPSQNNNTWTSKIFCFGSSQDTHTADRAYTYLLEQNGLGLKKVTFPNKNGDHSVFINKLTQDFPLLASQAGAIMVWKCKSGGGGCRPLQQILPSPHGYPIPFVRSNFNSGSIIYVTPLQGDLMNERNDTGIIVGPRSTCVVCKESIPLAKFPSHIAGCSKKMLEEDLAETDNRTEKPKEDVDDEEPIKNIDYLVNIFPNLDKNLLESYTDQPLDDAIDALLAWDKEKREQSASGSAANSEFEASSLLEIFNHHKKKFRDAGTTAITVDREEIWKAILLHYKNAICSNIPFEKELTVQFSKVFFDF